MLAKKAVDFKTCEIENRKVSDENIFKYMLFYAIEKGMMHKFYNKKTCIRCYLGIHDFKMIKIPDILNHIKNREYDICIRCDEIRKYYIKY